MQTYYNRYMTAIASTLDAQTKGCGVQGSRRPESLLFGPSSSGGGGFGAHVMPAQDNFLVSVTPGISTSFSSRSGALALAFACLIRYHAEFTLSIHEGVRYPFYHETKQVKGSRPDLPGWISAVLGARSSAGSTSVSKMYMYMYVHICNRNIYHQSRINQLSCVTCGVIPRYS